MIFSTPAQRSAAVDAILEQAPVLPVLAISDLNDALPLARALVNGGLPVLEITLRTDCALQAIERIASELPGAIVGAGTVLDGAQLMAVAAAGGTFAISPGATPAIYQAAAESDIPLIPAIATASELMAGMEHGHRRFKFFPAESSGGVAAVKSFAGPFADIRFCPTGGIGPATARSYLALSNVTTIGGSWMVPKDAVAARDWQRIENLAREAVALAKQA